MSTETVALALCVIFTWYATSAQTGECGLPGTSHVGPDAIDRTEHQTNSDHFALLMVDSHFPCYGTITRWRVYHEYGVGVAMFLQVWRPVDTLNMVYRLVGENQVREQNDYIIPSNPMNYDIQEAEQIAVQPDDVIGWVGVQEGGVSHAKFDPGVPGAAHIGRALIVGAGHPCVGVVPGGSCSWTLLETLGRNYSINAVVAEPRDLEIINLPQTIQVLENTQVGTTIFTVRGMYGHNWNSALFLPPNITYDESNAGGNVDIDSITGKVFTTGSLESGVSYKITMPVTVSYGGQWRPKNEDLTIDVIHVEYPPFIFTNLPAVRQISAQTPCGTIHNVDVNPSNSDVRFVLVEAFPNTDMFSLNTNNGIVTCTSLLDGEYQGETSWVLSLQAHDGINWVAPANLTITITNLRGPPHITNLPNVIHVREDVTAETPIWNVTAQRGENDLTADPLKFRKVRESPIDVEQIPKFKVATDGTIGNLSSIAAIDSKEFNYLEVQQYVVEVVVEDSIELTDLANLTVEVDWVNQAPVFLHPKHYMATLPERQPAGTVVSIQLSATDRDEVLGDHVTYNVILGNTGSELFTIPKGTQELVTKSELQVPPGETAVSYSFQVQAVDNDGLTDLANITVTVLDINDHQPVFNPDVYTANVSECTMGGFLVTTVTATDEDGGINVQMEFTIVGELGNLYFEVKKVTSTSAEIYLKQPISYVDYQEMVVVVMAKDLGQPPLNSTCIIYVTVDEINTHHPTWRQNFYNTEIRSDARVGDIVYTVDATSLDTDEVNEVTYFLIVPDEDFEIHSGEGHLMPKRGIKGGQKYLLFANARDNGQPEFLSDPAIIRLDAYHPPSHLVDIYLLLPLDDFKNTTVSSHFIDLLEELLPPWQFTLESMRLDRDSTIVRVYALQDTTGTGLSYEEMYTEKLFVGRDTLLNQLQTSLFGNPEDDIRGPDFSYFKPYKVLPAYPNWFVDTVEGIVTLTLLCLLTIVMVVVIIVLLKKFQLLCFKNKISPQQKPIPKSQVATDGDEFNLKYMKVENTKYTTNPIKYSSKPKRNKTKSNEEAYIRASVNEYEKDRTYKPPAATTLRTPHK